MRNETIWRFPLDDDYWRWAVMAPLALTRICSFLRTRRYLLNCMFSILLRCFSRRQLKCLKRFLARGINPNFPTMGIYVFDEYSKSDPMLLFWRCELNTALRFDWREPLEYLRGLAYSYDTHYNFIHIFMSLHYTHLSVSKLAPKQLSDKTDGAKKSPTVQCFVNVILTRYASSGWNIWY